MIKTDFYDLVPFTIGITWGGIYTDFFFSHEWLSNIAIFFGMKSLYFLWFTIVLFIYSLIKNLKNNKEKNLLKKMFFSIFSLRNSLLCISGFLFSVSIFSFNNHLKEATMLLISSIYLYFLVCCIRLVEEKLFSELWEEFKPYFQKIRFN
ncbi:MAG: hypothetical protein RR569_11340 [Acinetobacter sp.]